jgi:hypothetical protein
MTAEGVTFLAEPPRIFDNDLIMPWPETEVFVDLAKSRLDRDGSNDPEDWYFRNTVANVKDAYFRMRYRSAAWPWKDFHPTETLSDQPEMRLQQYLGKGYWALAADEALQLYQQHGDPQHRRLAVLACGLHIYDALQHSWPFIDPALKNDSQVREKHMSLFLYRIRDVSQLDMDETESAYFDAAREQFHMAYAEIAAQSSCSASNSLAMMDDAIRQTGEFVHFEQARSSLLNLSYLTAEKKHRVIERYKKAAADTVGSDYGNPYFCMALLHLMGLASMPDFYPQDYLEEPEWWRLTPEEIMVGDMSRLQPKPAADAPTGR